ncbi:MAG: CPBP family intramembrane glutamic endopeptidase [Bacteroidota bacterium]
MRDIVGYLKSFIREDFNLFLYLYTGIFLLAAFFINYSLDFESSILDKCFGKPHSYLYYILYYAFPYFMVALPVLIYNKNKGLTDRNFWIKSLVFISLIGIAAAFYSYESISESYQLHNERFYVRKILINSKRLFLYIVPLIIMKLMYDRNQKGLYGLHFSKLKVKPYFLMLLIVFPLVLWASFQQDFLHTYPKLKPWIFPEPFGMSKFSSTAVFEFFYVTDFVFVELIFRGALVIGLSSLLGKDVILPMVAAYAFLHFGKPMAEAISSIFGGYILGVIALNTRNIIGGCIIHMGVAFMMELLAFFQYYALGNH